MRRNRCSSNGGCAYGMPRKAAECVRQNPRTAPALVSTTTCSPVGIGRIDVVPSEGRALPYPKSYTRSSDRYAGGDRRVVRRSSRHPVEEAQHGVDAAGLIEDDHVEADDQRFGAGGAETPREASLLVVGVDRSGRG